MRLIDEQYTRTPVYGYRRMTAWLKTQGYAVNPKRVLRLMRLMGLEAIYPKPSLSKRNKDHAIYPYLLENVSIVRPDQVFSTDITYIRLRKGFVYLTAVIDWYSRYVLDWEVSVTMDTEFCCATLSRVLMRAIPEIFNTDQGSQYTAKSFIDILKAHPIQIIWMGKVEPWTTSSWRVSGAPSNRRRSISMTTGISPKPKTACRPISSGTTRNVSINPWSTTPPSRFTPAGSPWFRRLRETFGTPTPKTKTSENHFREHDQGEQESFYDVFSPKNHPQIITLSESIFCLDIGEHFSTPCQVDRNLPCLR